MAGAAEAALVRRVELRELTQFEVAAVGSHRRGPDSCSSRRGAVCYPTRSPGSVQGDMLASFVQWGLVSGTIPQYPRAEAAERAGVEPDVFEQVLAAAGLSDQMFASDDDIETIKLVAIALQFGLPLGAVLEILRVWADAMGKVAATRAFHLRVHERFRAERLHGAERHCCIVGWVDAADRQAGSGGRQITRLSSANARTDRRCT